MANVQNLRVPTSEEARRNGRKGGIASGKARAIAKTFRETINDELSDESLKKIIKKIISEAQRGNMKAVELLRDTRGEKPVDRQEVKEVTSEWFK
jgi:ribosomal protein S3AE